jgi:hypothetical protein
MNTSYALIIIYLMVFALILYKEISDKCHVIETYHIYLYLSWPIWLLYFITEMCIVIPLTKLYQRIK